MQLDGEPDLVGELLAAFQEETPALIEGMRAAIHAGDSAKLRQAAHSLKGSSGNLGARALQALCGDLEKTGRHGTLAGAADLLARVEEEYPRVIRALEGELKNTG
jgi:HPt (histidine-containing phosphotransfer) domain-containing protein